MGYTRRKIRGINFSFLLAGLVFACWALLCAWYGWPRGFRHSNLVGFGLFALAAVFFTAFPAIWARYPAKHPVNHELARYGKLSEISKLLDQEVVDGFEVLGPFRFTKSFLIYDSGHEFQLVPYDQIVAAAVDKAGDEDPSAIVVSMRSGRKYQWYRTFMQGRFDPEKVLETIRAAAHLDEQCTKSVEESAG